MKRSNTLFLKSIIMLIGMAVGAICLLVLPEGIRTTSWSNYRPLLIGMYIPAVPFYIALYQGFKLLEYIDSNRAFSTDSITRLRIIKKCAYLISVLYLIGLPYIFKMAQWDDAPGVMFIGLIFTFGPLTVGVLASVLERLLKNAIKINKVNQEII